MIVHSGVKNASIPTEKTDRPAAVADLELYQPSSGLEGAAFMAAFCDRCQHDAAFQAGTGDSCPIAADTMVFHTTDEGYPREWVYDPEGYPTCTAFLASPDSSGKASAGGRG